MKISRILRRAFVRAYSLVRRVASPGAAAAARRGLEEELALLDRFLRQEGIELTVRVADIPLYIARWEKFIDERFDPRDPEAFYRSWTGEVGALGLAVNVADQLRRADLVAALMATCPFAGARALDVGAGSAALWRIFEREAREVVLCDVENLAFRYNAFKFGADPRFRLIHPDRLGDEREPFDIVLCIDVLEHLREPVRVLHEMDRLVRPGGHLVLQAPWGGGLPEHIPEAPADWKKNGGDAFLAERYRLRKKINPLIALYAPSGIYLKT